MTVTMATAAANSVMRGALVTIGHASTVNGGTPAFTGIPNTYKDLMCVVNVVASATYTGTGIWPRINSDTGANYSYSRLHGDGTTYSSARSSNQSSFWPLDVFFGNNIPGSMIIHLYNYADTSRLKHGLIRTAADANGSGSSTLYAVTWRQTAAINEITLFTSGGNSQAAHITATLYGIRGIGQ